MYTRVFEMDNVSRKSEGCWTEWSRQCGSKAVIFHHSARNSLLTYYIHIYMYIFTNICGAILTSLHKNSHFTWRQKKKFVCYERKLCKRFFHTNHIPLRPFNCLVLVWYALIACWHLIIVDFAKIPAHFPSTHTHTHTRCSAKLAYKVQRHEWKEFNCLVYLPIWVCRRHRLSPIGVFVCCRPTECLWWQEKCWAKIYGIHSDWKCFSN